MIRRAILLSRILRLSLSRAILSKSNPLSAQILNLRPTDALMHRFNKSLSLVLSIVFFLFSLAYVIMISNFSGIFGSGLFGGSAEAIDYVPISTAIFSIFIIFLTFKRYQSLVLWSCSFMMLAAIILTEYILT